MSYNFRRAARDLGRDASEGARWIGRQARSRLAWRTAGRRTKNSLVGSAINQLLALVSVAAVFLGMWLHEAFAVPAWLLYGAGFMLLCLMVSLNKRIWRSYARRWSRGHRGGHRYRR